MIPAKAAALGVLRWAPVKLGSLEIIAKLPCWKDSDTCPVGLVAPGRLPIQVLTLGFHSLYFFIQRVGLFVAQ
jgi:hypothetical protein